MFDSICDVLYREMKELDNKYSDDVQLTSQDLEHIDKIAHALKSIAGYEMIVNSESGYEGDSYARGRSRTTGRYVSRDGGYSGYSRDNGHSGRRY